MRGFEVPFILSLLIVIIMLLDLFLRNRHNKAVFKGWETKTLLFNSVFGGTAKAKVTVYPVHEQMVKIAYTIQGFSGEVVSKNVVYLEITGTSKSFQIFPKPEGTPPYRLQGKLLPSDRVEIAFDYKPKPW